MAHLKNKSIVYIKIMGKYMLFKKELIVFLQILINIQIIKLILLIIKRNQKLEKERIR